jgi:thiamine biosynthesis lipoprotein
MTTSILPLVFAFAFTAASTLVAQDQSTPREIREFRGETMGTTYMVKIAGADGIDDQTLRFAIDGELRRVNDQMSTYLKSSEITQFNQSESTDWFPVSSEFAKVVGVAQQISKTTGGAFDITVSPLVNAWSFGTTKRTQTVPDASEIQSILESVGYQKLTVRPDPPALRKSIPELQIDLSSIAKGHGVDRVIERLATLGADHAFVEIGGEVRTAGDKPGGAWKVGIQLPDAASDTVMIAHSMLVNEPAGNAMATSGDYRNHFSVDGKRYSHTIDPRTGSPVDHDLASVTVVAKTCMEADAWATALNVLGIRDGEIIASDNDLHTLLVARSGDEGFRMVGNGVLAKYAQKRPEPADAKNWMSAILPVAILTFGAFSILLFAMAIGVVFGRKSISGSCGGLANKAHEDGSTSCSLCSSPSDACKELRDKMAENR